MAYAFCVTDRWQGEIRDSPVSPGQEKSMDTEKIGSFIAEMRREQGLTQRELAERLSISDKAVSKWERGKSLPDISVMQALCRELSININELLSGERLSGDDYDTKAEENIMNLMEENKKQKELSGKNTILTIIGLFASVIVLILSAVLSGGVRSIAYYLDIPSALLVFILIFLFLATSGVLKDFFRGFRMIFKGADAYTTEQIRRAYLAHRFAAKSALIAGPIGTTVGVINILARIDDLSLWGPNLAVAILTVLYSFLLTAVFLFVQLRLKLMLESE